MASVRYAIWLCALRSTPVWSGSPYSMTSAVMSRTMPHLMRLKSPHTARVLGSVLHLRPDTVPEVAALTPSNVPI